MCKRNICNTNVREPNINFFYQIFIAFFVFVVVVQYTKYSYTTYIHINFKLSKTSTNFSCNFSARFRGLVFVLVLIVLIVGPYIYNRYLFFCLKYTSRSKIVFKLCVSCITKKNNIELWVFYKALWHKYDCVDRMLMMRSFYYRFWGGHWKTAYQHRIDLVQQQFMKTMAAMKTQM